MDKKKVPKEKKKISLRKATSTKEEKDRSSISFLNDMKTHGLVELFLSPLTQKILECRIGENITAETRWVFIKKEKVEDNMFLHDTSSEFLPIKRLVEEYPEPEMLIGSYSHIQDQETDFFLCTTVNVKQDILKIIEIEKKVAYERLWNLLHPVSKPWIDLGSENEVDASLSKSARTLFEITIDFQYPLPYHHSKFTLCFTKDIPHSYMEIFSGRFPYHLIYRKRIDASTQSTLPSKDKCLQRQLLFARNKYVQYSYQSEEYKMTAEIHERVKKFFLNKCDKLYETLVVNFNINLFTDDYKDLAGNDKGTLFKDPFELTSYQDVLNCKHKKVSCVSWNALVSGMVAVAYVVTPIYYLGKQVPIHNDAEDTVFNKHLILLWTYKDNVRPKLYIHAYREVMVLSFCPYDENILVGGYSNGQIAVWDITNRIAAVEMREALTHIELKHRAIMLKHTTWIKPPFGIQHVDPTITSLFNSSHRSAITSIVWIPPHKFISKLGQYEESEPDEQHMQFFTIALNGSTIQVWDLKPQKDKIEMSAKKHAQRLSKLPKSLTQADSPLKKLQRTFIPHYRILLKDSLMSKMPLTNIIAKNQMYVYKCLNPETIADVEERTQFRMLGLLHPFIDSNELLLTSALGTLSIVKWEGTNYNQGLNINSVPCTGSNFAYVHDGPIVTCETNPLLPEVLLTTGGSIFAIWQCEILNVPLIWRKCRSRYISGMWSFRHPLTLFMMRSDSHFEIWNFLEKSEGPVRSFRHKGNHLISMFSDSNRLHARKETFITTDIVGAVKLFNLPVGIINLTDKSKEDSIDYLKNIIAIKQSTEILKLKVKKRLEDATIIEKPIQDDEIQVKQPEEVPEPKIVKVAPQVHTEKVVPPAISKWKKRLEIHMTNVLMQKKCLNINEIERNRIPMQEIIEFDKKRAKQISHKMMTRDEDFKKVKEKLLLVKSQKISRRITVTLSKEMTKNLKDTYYENFKNIETETLQEIKNKKYKFILNWNHILQFGISRN